MAASNRKDSMISTTYILDGVTSDDEVLDLRLKVSSYDAKVGGVSFERQEGGRALMIIKHKDDVVLDTDNIRALVASAGDFTLDGPVENKA